MSRGSVPVAEFFPVRGRYPVRRCPAAIPPIEHPTRHSVGVEQIRHAKDQSQKESPPASAMFLSPTPEGQQQKAKQAGEQHITKKDLGQRQPAQADCSEKCRHPSLGLLAEPTIVKAERTDKKECERLCQERRSLLQDRRVQTKKECEKGSQLFT